MKTTVITLLILFAFVTGNAKEREKKSDPVAKSSVTTTFSGTVTDVASGELLAGVEIKLEGTDLKTYTDFDGNFSFKDLKPGEYKVVSTYISYKKNSKKRIISPNTKNIKIKLQASN